MMRSPHQASDAEARRIRAYYQTASWGFSRAASHVVAERREILLQAATELLDLPLAELTICDVGCGGGADLDWWRDLGVPETRLAGTELMSDRHTAAARRLPAADIRRVNAFSLPFESDRFQVTTASLVLSSILREPLRRELFDEMVRVTAAGGIVMLYDFRIRRPSNRSVVPMTRRAIRSLGRTPNRIRPLTPFLPLLRPALQLPGPLRSAALRILPRTHAIWTWRV